MSLGKTPVLTNPAGSLKKAFCMVVVTTGTHNTVKLDPNNGEKSFFRFFYLLLHWAGETLLSKTCLTPQSTLSTPKCSSLQGWQRWGSPPEALCGFLPSSPTKSPWPCRKAVQAAVAAVTFMVLVPTLLCDAWEDAASRPCSSSSCSSSSCSSVGSKLYMGMSWCRSFSNLPRGGKGKAWLRRTGLRLLPYPTAEAFCRLLLLLNKDSAPVTLAG